MRLKFVSLQSTTNIMSKYTEKFCSYSIKFFNTVAFLEGGREVRNFMKVLGTCQTIQFFS